MVLGVCKRILRDAHRAEDAFQATFLILVRKAGSLRCESTLAGWLYRVALNTARHARADSLRRRETAEVADMPNRANDSADEAADWTGLQPILDEEMQRLPERLRLVLVLCGLEGRSREEVSRLLGISAGAVKGRLERGRERLRRRLERRGFALPAAGFATLLASSAAPAVPAALTASTLNIVRAVSAGQAVAAQSAAVARIVEGVLHTMLMNRIRFVAVALASFVLLLGGAVLVSQWFSVAPVISAPVAAPTDLFAGEFRVLDTPAKGKIIFSPDGRQLAFAVNGKIELWDTAALIRGTGPARTVDLPDAGPLSISPEGKLLAVTYKEGLKLVPLGKDAPRVAAATDKAL
jgi:RNA polymerase sigma factor (sigma-70 family)